MKKFVIENHYAGLGDHLFLSHIPKIALNSGYDRVEISNRSMFRNPEIRDLVWNRNPFVSGFTDDIGLKPKLIACDGNLLDQIMIGYGLDDGLRYHDPEVYIKIKGNESSLGIVYDPNYVSYVGAISKKMLNNLISQLGVNFQLTFRGRGFPISDLPQVSVNSLVEYCELILQSSVFTCFTSGGATLASALGVKTVAFFGNGQDKIFHHSKHIDYVDVGAYDVCGYGRSWVLKVNNYIRSKIDLFI